MPNTDKINIELTAEEYELLNLTLTNAINKYKENIRAINLDTFLMTTEVAKQEAWAKRREYDAKCQQLIELKHTITNHGDGVF